MHTTCTCLDGLHAPEHHSTGYRAREFAEIVAAATGRHVVETGAEA